MEPDAGRVTRLLVAWQQGDDAALNQLTPLIYDHLHRLARHYIASERPGHTLQPTALVNEAYLRLVDLDRLDWRNRAQFYSIAAQTMRRILVDVARARGNRKRGGDAVRIPLEEGMAVPGQLDPSVIALNDAINELAKFDARKAKVVELRFFGGLEEKEIAELLQISTDTVQRDWKSARAWLLSELKR